MTNAEKLIMLQTILDDGGEVPTEDKLETYLTLAGTEILNWMYHLVGGVPETVTCVPAKYDVTHVYAVAAGYTHAGAEGEASHDENGIKRIFMYSDMVDYIHNHVLAYVRVGAVSNA